MVRLESQGLPVPHRERMMLSQVHPHHSNRTVPHTTRKMTKRVSMVRQEDEDRRVRQEPDNLPGIVENEVGEEEVTEGEEGESEDLYDQDRN